MLRIPFNTMKEAVQEAFLRAGLSPIKAETCAQIHTESSCDGVSSHGLNRVARFVDYVGKGWVDLEADPKSVSALGPLAVFDGGRGIGITNALFATDRAMELAASHGVGIVGLRNTTHWMRGGTYGLRALEQGYAVLCWTNTESCMPAWGGTDKRLGNNPFVMAVPRAEGPLLLDMAMSQYAYGKLQTTRLKGEKLPFPGGYDGDGNLTDDPGSIEQSMRILPMGYWKGAGMATLLDAMAALLSAGLPTPGIDAVDQGSCTGASQIFMVFDIKRLNGASFNEEVANSIVRSIKSSTPAQAGREVLYPGERTFRDRQENMALGIPADETVWRDVLRLAGREG